MTPSTRYYRCAHGHSIAAHVDVCTCPALVHGCPCPGDLVETDGAGRRRRTVR